MGCLASSLISLSGWEGIRHTNWYVAHWDGIWDLSYHINYYDHGLPVFRCTLWHSRHHTSYNTIGDKKTRIYFLKEYNINVIFSGHTWELQTGDNIPVYMFIHYPNMYIQFFTFTWATPSVVEIIQHPSIHQIKYCVFEDYFYFYSSTCFYSKQQYFYLATLPTSANNICHV